MLRSLTPLVCALRSCQDLCRGFACDAKLTRGLLIMFLLMVLLCAPSVRAQTSSTLEAGIKPFGAYDISDVDAVSFVNGKLSLNIPLYDYPQRGGNLKLRFGLQYHVPVLTYTVYPNVPGIGTRYVWSMDKPPGVFITNEANLPIRTSQRVFDSSGQRVGYTDYPIITFDDESSHVMADIGGNNKFRTVDASGYYLDEQTIIAAHTVHKIRTPSGIQYADSFDGTGTYIGWTVQDSNGNTINANVNNSQVSFIDTIGRTIPGPPASSGQSVSGGTPTTDYAGCSGALPTAAASLWAIPAPSGATATLKFCFANVWIWTGHFATIDVRHNEPKGYYLTIQSIVLPNGTTWTFNYSAPTTTQGVNLGDLVSITFPTGGSIAYTWSNFSECPPFGANSVQTRSIVSRTIDPGDGSGPLVWGYSSGARTVTDPQQNDTVHTMTHLGGSCSIFETQSDYYRGTGASRTLLKSVKTDYSYTANYNDGPSYTTKLNVVPIRVTTLLDNQIVSKVEKDYDTGFTYYDVLGNAHTAIYGRVVAEREYDFTANQTGTLARQTTTSYAWQAVNTSYQNYLTANLLNTPFANVVMNGSGYRCAEQDYTYDTPARLISSSVSTQHGAPPGPARGNVSAIARWLSATPCVSGASGSFLTSYTNTFDTGTINQTIDPLGHTTTYSYSPSFASAYATQVQLPDTTSPSLVHHISTADYDFNTGLVASKTDENLQPTYFDYDISWRLTDRRYPDTGVTHFSYTDSIPSSVTVTSAVSNSPVLNKVETAVLDGLGRVKQAQLADPDCHSSTGLVYVDFTYGYNVKTTSNPYCQTTDGTYGTTTTQYDPLGRLSSIVRPDGSTLSYSYSVATTTITDEAQKQRTTQIDGIGRQITVWEDPSSLNYETDYIYDPLDNLTSVTQKGGATSASWRSRTFQYDSLSRLISASNPEAGNISYTYDNDGAVKTRVSPQANQTGTATMTTNYFYDELNRLVKQSYVGITTPTVLFGYDGVNPTGCTPPSITSPGNRAGRRSGMCDGSGSTSWSYDALGRVATEKRMIPAASALTNVLSYTYNVDGSLATVTYPSGRIVTYTPNAVGRLTSAVESAHGLNYVTAATYAPHGALSGLQNGASVNRRFTYNVRLQPLQIYFTNGAIPSAAEMRGTTCPTTFATIMSTIYDFGVSTHSNNGNVQIIQDCINATRTENFHYDRLNRIADAYTAGQGASIANWGEVYTIDAWGNLTNIDKKVGWQNSETLSAATASVKNQLPGFGYDAAGNLRSNSPFTYTFDAENRLASVVNGSSTWTYIYDGDGKRVIKCSGVYPTCASGTLYWSGMDNTFTETDWTGAVLEEYVFFNGKRVARRDATGNTVHYYFADHLGSTGVITGSSGAIQKLSLYYPFGGEIPITAPSFANTYKFTGKERDTESGLDYFGARFLSSSQGRFMTPDWAAMPTTVPYANFGDPQTLNLYSYVRNSAATLYDLDGHCWRWAISVCNYLNYGVWGDEKKVQAAENAARARLAADQKKRAANGQSPAIYNSGRRNANGRIVYTTNTNSMTRDAVLNPHGVDASSPFAPFVVAGGVGIVLYRSGSVALGPNDIKTDKNGFVTKQQGLSLNINAAELKGKFPDAEVVEITSIPEELDVRQQGRNPNHYIAVPRQEGTLTPEQYINAVRKIETRAFEEGDTD